MEDNEKSKLFERRRIRLIELINEKCNGNRSEFARSIGREPSYVVRMLYPEGKKDKKRISDTIMIAIENRYNLPRGWFDADTDTELDWPFVISRKQYQSLSAAQKNEINQYMLFVIGKNLTS